MKLLRQKCLWHVTTSCVCKKSLKNQIVGGVWKKKAFGRTEPHPSKGFQSRETQQEREKNFKLVWKTHSLLVVCVCVCCVCEKAFGLTLTVAACCGGVCARALGEWVCSSRWRRGELRLWPSGYGHDNQKFCRY